MKHNLSKYENKDDLVRESNNSSMSFIWKYIFFVLVILGLAVALVAFSHSSLVSPSLSVGLNALELILVSVAVHLIDRAMLEQDHLRVLRQSNQKVIETLFQQSSSLNALDQGSVEQVFTDRDKLVDTFKKHLTNPDTKQLLLMGISLNDFLLHDQNNSLYGAFGRFLANKGTQARLLLIDPSSQGALLRERAEHRFIPASSTRDRLEEEVRSGIKVLEGYLSDPAPNDDDPKAGLLYRLYKVAPSYFMFVTPTDCYIQPYHFWMQRGKSKALPVLHYRALPGSTHCDLMAMLTGDTEFASRSDDEYLPSTFEEMVAHFAWIWSHASTKSRDFNRGVKDIERSALRGDIRTLFPSEPAAQITRMTALMSEAKECIWLLGISLKSFADSELMLTMLKAAEGFAGKKTVDGEPAVRFLVIDPSSEEAQFRASREHQIRQERMGTKEEDIKADEEDSAMLLDTFLFVETALGSMNRRGKKEPSMGVRMYEHFPSCFLCRIDNHIFVEQYHLGSGAESKLQVLGKNMPLIEFVKEDSIDAEDQKGHLTEVGETKGARDPKEHPFEVLVSHFEFQWKNAETMDTLQAVRKKKTQCRDTIKKSQASKVQLPVEDTIISQGAKH